MALFLAMDGGGTGTRAGLYNEKRELLAEADGRASNPIAYGADTCLAVLASVAREVLSRTNGIPTCIAVALAGARERGLREEIAQRLADHLDAPRVLVTDDLRPILFANAGCDPAILTISGTGSSVLAQDGNGQAILVGGRGAILGDEGSAYRVGVAALRACAHALDGLGPSTALLDALPKAAGVADFPAMPAWAERAEKLHLAELARTVEWLALDGDAVALACLRNEAECLAAQVEAAHRRMRLPATVRVYRHGSLLTQSVAYREAFETALRNRLPEADVRALAYTGHRAVLETALAEDLPSTVPVGLGASRGRDLLPPTERTSAVHLDDLDALGIVRHMNHADGRTVEAVRLSEEPLARAVTAAGEALKRGGRVVYAGAGTSGRLGVLDASECPPTFGVSRDRVIGLMAGGEAALRSSVEGVEDDREQAARDIAGIKPPVGSNDVVVGIAASGTTPYALGSIDAARGLGATTVLLCCNPAAEAAADIVIALDTGPEVLPGSTRLKAGTATKMALNILSTGAMALSGHVFEGLMVGMRPVNSKLRRRAVRILQTLTGLEAAAAEALLDEANGSIGAGVVAVRAGIDIDEAKHRLAKAGGNVREALHNP